LPADCPVPGKTTRARTTNETKYRRGDGEVPTSHGQADEGAAKTLEQAIDGPRRRRGPARVASGPSLASPPRVSSSAWGGPGAHGGSTPPRTEIAHADGCRWCGAFGVHVWLWP